MTFKVSLSLFEKMDLPYVIKKEEAVEYFLISTPDEEIRVAANFDKYSSDANFTEILRKQIKQEPTDTYEYINNGPENDPDFVPNECETDSAESGEDEKQKYNDSDEDWCFEKSKKRPKTKLKVKSKFKYREISTEFVTCNGPPYTCFICSITFPLEKTLKIHQRMHEGKKYQCDICNKVFREKVHIYEHMKMHGERQYSCPICEKTFAIKKSWIHHQGIHEEKKFECEICKKRFRQKGHIWEHMKIHRERTRNFKCELCHMAYYEQRTLTRHMRLSHSNTPRKRFRCPNTLCDKSYSSVSSFKMHACIDGKRPESLLKTSCPVCGRWFYNKFEVNRHVKRIHINKVESSVCEKCNKTFLPRHWDLYLLHTAQNCGYPIMYTCDYCSKYFPSKPKMIEHFADKHGIVSDLMTLSCHQCDKKFLLQNKLNFHLKTAHNSNCEHCGKKFRSGSGFRSHQKYCVPKKIFDKYSKYVNSSDQISATNECNICNRSFIKRIYLIEHMEVVHSEMDFKVNGELSKNSKKQCPLCKKYFISLSKHKKRMHEDKRRFKCQKCDQKFVGAMFYRKHVKANNCVNGILQYQCTVCSKIYSRNCDLTRHTQMHSQESILYECDHCTRTFSAKRNLLRHLEKGDHRITFECEMCSKSFKRISAYKTHKNYCKMKNDSKESALVLS